MSCFFTEFLEDKDDLEIVMENVLDEDWRLLLDVYKQVNLRNLNYVWIWDMHTVIRRFR